MVVNLNSPLLREVSHRLLVNGSGDSTDANANTDGSKTVAANIIAHLNHQARKGGDLQPETAAIEAAHRSFYDESIEERMGEVAAETEDE